MNAFLKVWLCIYRVYIRNDFFYCCKKENTEIKKLLRIYKDVCSTSIDTKKHTESKICKVAPNDVEITRWRRPCVTNSLTRK